MNAVPMNMASQEPSFDMIIGIVAESGFAEVPEAKFIKDIPALFISCAHMGAAASREMAHNCRQTIHFSCLNYSK
jgi:hypothetical protein